MRTILALSLICSVAFAAIEVPKLTGPLVDEYGLLQTNQQAKLDQQLRELQRRAGVQMAVLIPKTLQQSDIESYAMAVAEKWQLGKKGEDKGLLLIVAPAERKMRIEVGYGLEGTITDAHSRRLLNGFLQPAFRQGDYYNGIRALVQAVGDLVTDPEAARQMIESPRTHGRGAGWVIFLALLFIMFGFIMPLMSIGGGRGIRGNTWRRGGWGGGGFGGGGFGGGGGGFGGGGGGFGGGGSSSSW